MKKQSPATQFAVLGLGRFGLSVVRTLAESDVHILACDRDEALLHEAAEYATRVVKMDAADEDALAKLGLGNFDVVVMPEIEAGVKIGRRLMRNNVLNALEDSGQLDVTEMHPLPEWVGKSVRDSDIRHKYGISLLAVVRDENPLIPMSPDAVLWQDDLLVVLCGTCGVGG